MQVQELPPPGLLPGLQAAREDQKPDCRGADHQTWMQLNDKFWKHCSFFHVVRQHQHKTKVSSQQRQLLNKSVFTFAFTRDTNSGLLWEKCWGSSTTINQ